MLGLAGVTAMDTSVAGVIVSVVVSDTVPEAAVIVVGPVINEVARP
jgi:anti-anti-sigma regulatory factor